MDNNSLDILEWAFAGKSHTSKEATSDGVTQPQHSVWEHWIDSKSNNPSVDEGDMWLQPNGDILERGFQSHPFTGTQCEYEELWGDLEVVVVGEEGKRVSVALKVEDDVSSTRGLVVRVGNWCQGILKIGDEITVERWHSKLPQHSAKSKLSDWIREMKIGHGALPCEATFNIKDIEEDAFILSNDLQWKVIEKYSW